MDSYKITFINSVIDELRKFNIVGDVAAFIGCQFALESNFGLSDLAKYHYNYCGMKLPVVRCSTAVNFGSNDKWSYYSSFSDCVTDFVLCLTFRRPMSCYFDSINQYCFFIRGWYCPEKSYLDKISSIYVQFQNYLKNGKKS